MRRAGAGRRSGWRIGRALGGRSIAQQFAAIQAAKGRFDFRASRFNPSGGNVASFINSIDPTDLLTPSLTLAAPAADAAMLGALTCNFTTQTAPSNKVASAYDFLVNGTGASFYHVYVNTNAAITNFLAATRDYTGLDSGISVLNVSGSGPANAVINAGAATWAAQVGGSQATGVGLCQSFHWNSSAYASFQGATSLGSGVPAAAPSGGATPFSVNGSGVNVGQQRWWGSFGFTLLTPAERNVVAALILTMTGVVAT